MQIRFMFVLALASHNKERRSFITPTRKYSKKAGSTVLCDFQAFVQHIFT